MKKFFIIFSIIVFSFVLSAFIFLQFKNNCLKKDNNNLNKDITSISDNNTLLSEENKEYEENINGLKSEKENIIKEVNIWKETKEKVEKALS